MPKNYQKRIDNLIAMATYAEEKIPIAFNPGFLIDGIDIIGGKNIIFCIVEPLKPILIKPEKGDSLIYLLMPIRIS